MAAARDNRRCAFSAFLSDQSGFSLVEMVISILLIAIIVTATFSALLLTQTNVKTSDLQMIANQARSSVLDTLKNYQSASISGPDAGSGPNQAGISSWSLPDEMGTGCDGNVNCPSECSSAGNACAAGSYALEVGCYHNVTRLLPSTLQNPPYNGVMCYVVTDLSGAIPPRSDQSIFRPQVQMYIKWTKPTQ